MRVKVRAFLQLTTSVDDIEMLSDARVTRISKFIGAGIYATTSFPMTALDHELESSSRLTLYKGKRISIFEYSPIHIINALRKNLPDVDCESAYI